MAVRLTDAEIAELLAEAKPLPADYRRLLETRTKRGHKERELSVQGENGHVFRLILRQSEVNPLDFSAILAYQVPRSNQIFRLRRYNGRSHRHTNRIESPAILLSDPLVENALAREAHRGGSGAPNDEPDPGPRELHLSPPSIRLAGSRVVPDFPT